jgi:mono/diheme cytochrome c family protein
MTSRPATPGALRGRLATLLVAAAAIFVGSLSATAQDMQAVERGRKLYDETAGGVGCASCHARYALGDIGPMIRGFTAGDIETALGTIPDMSFISLNPTEIGDIAAFLHWLSGFAPTVVQVKDGKFVPESVTVPSGTRLQLIVDNADRSPYDLEADGAEPTLLLGRAMADLTWSAPLTAGTFDVTLLGSMREQLAKLVVTVAAP